MWRRLISPKLKISNPDIIKNTTIRASLSLLPSISGSNWKSKLYQSYLYTSDNIEVWVWEDIDFPAQDVPKVLIVPSFFTSLNLGSILRNLRNASIKA